MFVNWNYIILVVLTVEFHITKLKKNWTVQFFRIWNLKKLDSPSKNWTVGRYEVITTVLKKISCILKQIVQGTQNGIKILVD